MRRFGAGLTCTSQLGGSRQYSVWLRLGSEARGVLVGYKELRSTYMRGKKCPMKVELRVDTEEEVRVMLEADQKVRRAARHCVQFHETSSFKIDTVPSLMWLFCFLLWHSKFRPITPRPFH